MSIVASTLGAPSAVVMIVTSKDSNEPRTFEIARCLTVKVIVEWVGSSLQVPATKCGWAETVEVVVMSSIMVDVTSIFPIRVGWTRNGGTAAISDRRADP
jgi:hypothetical protein